MEKLVLKICKNSWETASRDRRELSVCRELGAKVLVMAKGNPDDAGRFGKCNGFDVMYYGTRPLGNHIPKAINQMIAVFQWAGAAKKLKPSIITGHNLSGLAIGWIANFILPKSEKALLVYDAHEYEMGRLSEHNKIAQFFIPKAEKFLIKRCAFSIMINEGIAAQVKKDYRLDFPVVIAKSTPELWQLDEKEIARIRTEYHEKLGIPEGSFILSYHGNIQRHRGLEEILSALEQDETLYAVWVGSPQTEEMKAYEDQLVQRAKKNGVDKRLLRYPAQPHSELWKYVAAASAEAVVMNEGQNPNYRFALPNKFFEAIQSLSPIICTNTVEMSRIINRYDIGILIPSGDGAALVKAALMLREDKELYEKYKKNLVLAKNDLCWENEKKSLKETYARYLTVEQGTM